MIANNICVNLYRKMQYTNFTGLVHSVFHNAFNVITSDNEFITFLNFNKPMAPYTIRVSDTISFLNLGIESSMTINFYHNYIKLERLGIDIFIDKASKWDGNPIFAYPRDDVESIFEKLELMKDFLIHSEKREGILSLLTTLNDKYCGFQLLPTNQTLDKGIIFIKERFSDFIESYIGECKANIGDRVKDVVGFGPGLTPSMDDFINGLMISRIYLFDYLNKDIVDCLAFNQLMIEKIEGKTTRVSEEMLKTSSKGEVNQDIRDLMLSLLSYSNIDDYNLLLKRVADFGETSGTDIISGIYIGSIIQFNQFSRR